MRNARAVLHQQIARWEQTFANTSIITTSNWSVL